MKTPKPPNKDVRQNAARLTEAGCCFTRIDSRGHYVYTLPNGNEITIPGTPAPHGAWRRRACKDVLNAWPDAPAWIRDLARTARTNRTHATARGMFNMNAALRDQARPARVHKPKPAPKPDAFDLALERENRKIRTAQLQREADHWRAKKAEAEAAYARYRGWNKHHADQAAAIVRYCERQLIGVGRRRAQAA